MIVTKRYLHSVAKWTPHASLTAIFALWMAFTFFAGSHIFNDADSAWHLAAGDLIRASGTLPHTDPWSFTADNTFWYNLSWSYDVAISWLNEHYGKGVLFGACLCVYALCGGLQARFAYVHGKASPSMVLLSCYVCLLVMNQGLLLRPHMLSLLFTQPLPPKVGRLS